MENTRSLSGILYTDINDHFPVYHIDYFVSVPLHGKSFKKRVYSMAKMERFSTAMREMIGMVCYRMAMHRVPILYSVMHFVMFITHVLLWKFLNKFIEPGNHGYPKGWKIQ